MAYTAIFAGGFGSGKTEIALNFAFDRAKKFNNVILADLDLVNPFFVSRDMKEKLDKHNIRLMAPKGELSFGDVPHIPSEILGLLAQDNEMIIDLAGDEVGSLVLGYISNYVKKRLGFEFFLVINPYRPFAESIEAVNELKEGLEAAAKISFTGIISNPNLVEETELETIISGHKKVLSYANHFKLPVKYLTVEARFYESLKPIYGELLRIIELNLRPEWL